MFKGDMSEQWKKWMMINLTVKALDDVGPLVPTLKKMGADHAGYGVKLSDYNVVGAALLWTLEQGRVVKFYL